MGTVSSKDTRRISFDNTFAVTPALVVHHKSIGDNNVLDLEDIAAVTVRNADSNLQKTLLALSVSRYIFLLLVSLLPSARRARNIIQTALAIHHHANGPAWRIMVQISLYKHDKHNNGTVEEKGDDLVFPESKIPPLQEKESTEVDYWANRIESLKQEHRLINKIIETEYEKTLQDTSILLKKPYSETQAYNKIKPCFEWRSKIMQCYEDNPRQPLVCAPIVNAFSECVTSCRLED